MFYHMETKIYEKYIIDNSQRRKVQFNKLIEFTKLALIIR